jgi:hypothetical protein
LIGVVVEKLLETAAADTSDVPDKNDIIIKTKATFVNAFFIRSSCIVTYLCFHKLSVIVITETAEICIMTISSKKLIDIF